MSGGPAPFCINRNAVNIQGGLLLNRDWCPAITSVRGKEFIALHREDRKLSRAMGLDMELRDPWSTRSILPRMAFMRDERIDALIKKKLCEDDEMSSGTAVIPKSQRARCYHAACVPDVLTLEFPEFEMDNGQQHPSAMIDVLSTHMKGSTVSIELTVENLQFLQAAAHSPTFTTTKRKAKECELVPLTLPNVKWRRRGQRGPVIMCWYRAADGNWKTHSEEPAQLNNVEAMQIAVRECEFRCQEPYQRNHVEEIEGDQDTQDDDGMQAGNGGG